MQDKGYDFENVAIKNYLKGEKLNGKDTTDS